MSSKRYKSVIGRATRLLPDSITSTDFSDETYWLTQAPWMLTEGNMFFTFSGFGPSYLTPVAFPIVETGKRYRLFIAGTWNDTISIHARSGHDLGGTEYWSRLSGTWNESVDFTADENGLEIYVFDSISVAFTTFIIYEISEQTQELLSVSGSSGVPIDRWGATLTTTAVTSFKDGDVRAMYFDGLANTDIVLGTTYTLPLAGSTIQVWFKTDPDFVSGDRWLLGYTSGGDSFLGFDATGDLALEDDSGDLWLDYPEANITPNIWYHLVVIANGGTVNTYLNDTLIDTTTPTDDVTFQYIGNYSAGNRPYWGQIGSVGLWDGALSVQEASQLHSSEKKWYGL